MYNWSFKIVTVSSIISSYYFFYTVIDRNNFMWYAWYVFLILIVYFFSVLFFKTKSFVYMKYKCYDIPPLMLILIIYFLLFNISQTNEFIFSFFTFVYLFFMTATICFYPWLCSRLRGKKEKRITRKSSVWKC